MMLLELLNMKLLLLFRTLIMYNSIVVQIDKILINYQDDELQIMVMLLMSNC